MFRCAKLSFAFEKRNERYRIFMKDVNGPMWRFAGDLCGRIYTAKRRANPPPALRESAIPLCEPLFHKTVDTVLLCM
jgi:hypothetical protein